MVTFAHLTEEGDVSQKLTFQEVGSRRTTGQCGLTGLDHWWLESGS